MANNGVRGGLGDYNQYGQEHSEDYSHESYSEELRKRRPMQDQEAGYEGNKRPTPGTGLSSAPQFTLRICCPADKSGVVIGRGGSIVAQLRSETGAKIKVEDFVSGCDMRVVSVVSEDDGEHECRAIAGLLRVYDRLSEPEEDGNVAVLADPVSGAVSARLISSHEQVLGIQTNAAREIEATRLELGVVITFHVGDEVPGCGNPDDDMILIHGGKQQVKETIARLAELLRRQSGGEVFVYNPKAGRPMAALKPSYSGRDGRDDRYGDSYRGREHRGGGMGMGMAGMGMMMPTMMGGMAGMVPASLELGFRLLCPCGRVGNVIGTRGAVVKGIREATGARISVLDRILNAEEQIVVISSPTEDSKPAIEALFQVHELVFAHEAQSGSVFRTRLLIHKSQVGCVLGKKGSIVTQIRNETGVQIRISADVPVCGNMMVDQVVQMNGDMEQIRRALKIVGEQILSNPPREDVPIIPSFIPPHIGVHHMAAGQTSSQNMMVPADSAGKILGKSGSNVAQIRAMSGARVKVLEPKPGALERPVVITGTPDQIQAAQIMIRVLIEAGPPPLWAMGGIPMPGMPPAGMGGAPPPRSDPPGGFTGPHLAQAAQSDPTAAYARFYATAAPTQPGPPHFATAPTQPGAHFAAPPQPQGYAAAMPQGYGFNPYPQQYQY